MAIKNEPPKMAILGFALTEAIALLYGTTSVYVVFCGYFLPQRIIAHI
jgi:hypothetical protein